jgi:hypothetical protein
MEPEGMVHALSEIHRLLRADGVLIEIHPVREPPTIEVRSDGELRFSEHDPGYDYEAELRSAEAAVAEVLLRGLFILDGEAIFDFFTHATSVRELREFFAVSGAYDEAPKDEAQARRQDDLYGHVEELMAPAGDLATLVYNERGHMNRLAPIFP